MTLVNRLVPSINSLRKSVCPPGMILRAPYTRKYSTAVLEKGFTRKSKSGKTVHIKPLKKDTVDVKPKCVKNISKPGKTSTLSNLKKGELSKFGYTIYKEDTREKKSSSERHEALTKAVESYGYLNVYRKLDAVAKLTLRKIPEVSEIYKSDRDWVQRTFGKKSI